LYGLKIAMTANKKGLYAVWEFENHLLGPVPVAD
jgi:hypothetical protein